jgi:RNA polymerase subunit RPABC4/transcription elongation factor Spt4
MSNKKNGSGALIIIVVVLLLLFMIAPIARFGLFHGLQGGMVLPALIFGEHSAGLPFVFMPALLMLIVWLSISIWVYNDAERKRMSGILWALLVFFGNLVGLIIYLIVRSGTETPAPAVLTKPRTCLKCKSPIQADFKVCPNCGDQLHQTCPKCEKNVQNSWNMCPYCGEKLKQE